jgi:hypothetical protein
LAGLAGPGQLATEESVVPPNFPFPRVSEQTAIAQLSKGVCASVMRLPQVHDTRKQGLSGRSSRLFWLVGYVRRSRPSGIKRYNKEKTRVESDRAGSDRRFGTDGSLQGCVRRSSLSLASMADQADRKRSPYETRRYRRWRVCRSELCA